MDNKKSERNKIGAGIYLIDEINVTSQYADALQLCLNRGKNKFSLSPYWFPENVEYYKW